MGKAGVRLLGTRTEAERGLAQRARKRRYYLKNKEAIIARWRARRLKDPERTKQENQKKAASQRRPMASGSMSAYPGGVPVEKPCLVCGKLRLSKNRGDRLHKGCRMANDSSTLGEVVTGALALSTRTQPRAVMA